MTLPPARTSAPIGLASTPQRSLFNGGQIISSQAASTSSIVCQNDTPVEDISLLQDSIVLAELADSDADPPLASRESAPPRRKRTRTAPPRRSPAFEGEVLQRIEKLYSDQLKIMETVCNHAGTIAEGFSRMFPGGVGGGR